MSMQNGQAVAGRLPLVIAVVSSTRGFMSHANSKLTGFGRVVAEDCQTGVPRGPQAMGDSLRHLHTELHRLKLGGEVPVILLDAEVFAGGRADGFRGLVQTIESIAPPRVVTLVVSHEPALDEDRISHLGMGVLPALYRPHELATKARHVWHQISELRRRDADAVYLRKKLKGQRARDACMRWAMRGSLFLLGGTATTLVLKFVLPH